MQTDFENENFELSDESVSSPIAASRPFGAAEGIVEERLSDVKVLVIEDSLDARRYIGRVYSQAGAEVHSAASSAQARCLLSATKYDLIVCDLMMPMEDGLSLLASVRSDGSSVNQATPAIAVTAMEDAAAHDAALKCGFQAFVLKQETNQTLISKSEALVRLPDNLVFL